MDRFLSIIQGGLTFTGYVLSFPGLLLVYFAQCIDDARDIRRVDQELDERFGEWGTKISPTSGLAGESFQDGRNG